MLELTLAILEYKSGSFTPEGGTNIDYSYAIANFAGREFKFKSKINLDAFVGKPEKDFRCSVVPNAARGPVIVIEGVV